MFRFHCVWCLLPRQLSGVAKGLNHLHSRDIIHGDLKGVGDRSRSGLTTWLTPRQATILVDASGHARITDFGLAAVTQDLQLIRSGSGECGDSVRWIAPEISDGRSSHSKEGDVFSFAMVMIEVRCTQSTQPQPRPKYFHSNEGFHRCCPVQRKVLSRSNAGDCWR